MTKRLFPIDLGAAAASYHLSSASTVRQPQPVIEIGALIARTFDLLEGTSLEPFAPQVASGLVNGARHRRRG